MTTRALPLIAIVGATGTGKSELAVNIAKRHNGEVINGDAMQLYAGLPIITNKISVDEQQGVPHHLLSCIGLEEQTWTVGDFVARALETIAQIRARGRLPVLVGGTHYYTQALLFHDALAQQQQAQQQTADTPLNAEADADAAAAEADANTRWPVLAGPVETMLAELQQVDPVMAARWHPRDHRKIRRSLEIYLQTGRPASEIYAEQRARRDGVDDEQREVSSEDEQAGQLRTRTLVLWVHADSTALPARLDARVDRMIARGLLHEVRALSAFAAARERAGKAVDLTRGIWVSIGYKEFLAYDAAVRAGEAGHAEVEKFLAEAVERTKAGTRQYAKRQVRWIRIKLNHAISAAGAKEAFFMLDGSELDSWQERVSDTGLRIVDAFLAEREMPDPMALSPLAREMLTPSRGDMSASVGLWKRQYCGVCDVTGVTESDWVQHIKSHKHKKLTAKAKAGPRTFPVRATGEASVEASGTSNGQGT